MDKTLLDALGAPGAADRLRTCVRGGVRGEAALEIVLRSPLLAENIPADCLIRDGDGEPLQLAWPHIVQAITSEAPWTRQMSEALLGLLAIAASLATALLPVHLGPSLDRLDSYNTGLAVRAVRHATGDRSAWDGHTPR